MRLIQRIGAIRKCFGVTCKFLVREEITLGTHRRFPTPIEKIRAAHRSRQIVAHPPGRLQRSAGTLLPVCRQYCMSALPSPGRIGPVRDGSDSA